MPLCRRICSSGRIGQNRNLARHRQSRDRIAPVILRRDRAEQAALAVVERLGDDDSRDGIDRCVFRHRPDRGSEERSDDQMA